MATPTMRPETLVLDLNGTTWRTLVPALDSNVPTPMGQYRMRRFLGGFVYNTDNQANTFQLRLNDGTTQTTILRVTIPTQYYRYIFDARDFRDLAPQYAIQINLTAGPTDPALIAMGRFTDV